MRAAMPGPIGHALAGAVIAWTADFIPGSRTDRTVPPSPSWYDRAGGTLTLACVLLAAAPDLDLLFRSAHRTGTHSLVAVGVVGLCAAAIAATARMPIVRVSLMCAAAYASHIFMDWLGVDRNPPRGIQALWPFSRTWYISDLDVFRQTAREHILSANSMRVNALAIAQEIAIVLPIAIVVWLVRVKTLSRFPAEVSRRDHAAQ
jgi:hypothetical protein